MKKTIILILSIILTNLLISCMGIRTNFKFPNEYGVSNWTASKDDINIVISVNENDDSYGSITYQETTNNYKVIFAVDGASFRCLNDNNEYVLEDGSSISQEQYESDFPNVISNVKGSSFVVTKTKDKIMECFITSKELNYIFPLYKYENEDEKIYFVFNMVEE